VAIWQLFTGAAVLSPLCISMLWAIYNAIPPYLILHFAIFGRVCPHSFPFMAHTSQVCATCIVLKLYCGSIFSGLLWCKRSEGRLLTKVDKTSLQVLFTAVSVAEVQPCCCVCGSVSAHLSESFYFCAGSTAAVHVQVVLRAGMVLWHCSPGSNVDHQGVQPQGIQRWHCTERVHWCLVPQDSQRDIDRQQDLFSGWLPTLQHSCGDEVLLGQQQWALVRFFLTCL
jgi:hypothetical protein